ncbi:S28 family serine protease [Parabacteroides bouchesdurhonensis]|uniref:S28 family serine protease n=1 Tax=Parabacteroides bouchesdurhonensis TaxID=1936995 RepID=UPI000E48B4A7|nr:S28 family serine protease [Parabacteroides bouchesdurhonensis]RHJ94009.1 aminopeptidase [Bacteroides sp. AM07-16]
MRRTSILILLLFSFMIAVAAATGELKAKLEALPGVSHVEQVKSDHYPEKYVVRITQPLDPKHPEAGSFTQRVIIGHVGFDRPTVLVTEGYGAAYAMNPRYQEELTQLLDANLVFVEYRYFLESTPSPLNWDYLTAENSAYDLHHVNQTFRRIYNTGKWISTGISKGGQTTLLYRAFFPDDVDFSVPYVAPLNRAVEDGRHEPFLRKVGTKAERARIKKFQEEVLKRRTEIVPLLEAFCKESSLRFHISMDEVLDYCVLEYPFAFWQWGTPVGTIPVLSSDTDTLFRHLVAVCSPDYFAEDQPNASFFVQAARELGYYGYDTKPLEKYLSIQSSEGYLSRIMLPKSAGTVEFRPELYRKVYSFLKDNDPKMIFIYGEIDPWSATRVPSFKGKKNEQVYIQPRGSHRARISNMPDDIKEKILTQINRWLAE